MVSAKKLIRMARKWRTLANIKRKRITYPKGTEGEDADLGCNMQSWIADKGHFVVYSADQRRFVLPLEYLNKEIFKELFRMAEAEFGLPGNGPITLPCDAASMEYAVAMIQLNIAKNLEKALVMAIATGCCPSSSSLPPDLRIPNQQMLICSF
ncbi:Auxin-induced protein 6B [Morella rubra]|uniref:Auxin-induced protein 6B n=1 Tax=Morella rubra TaxID=262757 RepID=A0A6A1V727_9ROSI|nr:Auxin-induced protein 6B [Morella rubra]